MTVSRVLIANRGEIAVRIIRACQALGIDTVLAVSDADRESVPARIAGRTVCIGPARATDSYLNVNAIVAAARGTGSDAVHPGYGFLAESPLLAEACAAADLAFVGPTAAQIREMGNKLQARALARECGIPLLNGSQEVRTPEEAAAIADRIGFPVMLKAAAGGGGRGMKIMADHRDLGQMFSSAAAEARSAFGDNTLYLERFIPNARHIEVQVLGDRFGNIIHLGERDCSLQRRHQKMVEEAPAPGISAAQRQEIRDAALTLGRKIGYENAGTVEFLFDQDAKAFFFLEMNTRIQVEHPVTEMITGIDLVQEQLRIARGERLRFVQSDVTFRGHAVECRINAESPKEDFRPYPGRIIAWLPPEGPNIRLDTHCYAGYTVPIFYDSMLGKLIVYGSDRAEAVERMRRALEQFVIKGIPTTLPFLRFVMTHAGFAAGNVSTRLVDRLVSEMLAQSTIRGDENKRSSEGKAVP
ncbi:MAG: acetyl-CoA carboxylase biotin carboxylase subunit [Alphaproteobacteria bacterium]|nr:acetyl-CoA carboxylase biotin carboxylase subunit [Alphaproteobacteria bacterium]